MLRTSIAATAVVLHPSGAAYLPDHQTLLVADAHFGKAVSFRMLGVPVPAGTTTETLETVSTAVSDTGAKRIVFLGDFLHSRRSHAKGTLATLAQWREEHADLDLTLVRGNHDLRSGDPAAVLGIEMVDEPFDMGPFSFCHHPDIAASGYVLAGHVHPVFRIATRLESVRLPCFLVGPSRMVLPSFGAFTGGHLIAPAAGERVFVVTEVEVHPVR